MGFIGDLFDKILGGYQYPSALLTRVRLHPSNYNGRTLMRIESLVFNCNIYAFPNLSMTLVIIKNSTKSAFNGNCKKDLSLYD